MGSTSTSGTGRKLEVPQVQGGRGEYVRYRKEVGIISGTKEEVRNTSGTGRKWGVAQVQGGSGEYLRYREEVGSTSGSGRAWGLGNTSSSGRKWGLSQVQGGSEGTPQVQGVSWEYLRYMENVGSTSGTGRKWEVP